MKKKLAFKTVYYKAKLSRRKNFMVIASDTYGHEIICINDEHCKRELTLGKKYVCHKTGERLFYVINDMGDRRGYNASRFD